MVRDSGLQDNVKVDSAGIIDYHEGYPADERMQKHAEKRDYNLTSISRPVNPAKDAGHFDYIIAMDTQNFQDLKSLLPKEYHHKR